MNMMSPILEIILLVVLILLNGVLAMAEIAIVSARKVRLQRRAEQGDLGAGVALELAREPADFLSTVQIGITLVGVLAGAFGGSTLATRVAPLFELIPSLAPYSHAISLVLVVLIITYFSLVLGELAPKRLALNDAERIAAFIAPSMDFMAHIAAPLVRLLSYSSDVVLAVFGVKKSSEPPITEDEVKVLIELGTQAGVFEEAEQDMVSGVFRLADRHVGTLMTPRTEIAWLDLEDPPEEIRRKIKESVHSRLPVAEGDLDHILGVVQAKGLLSRCMAGEPIDLRKSLIPPQFVPESTPALKVLEMFRNSRVHIAIVIDEYGGLQGLVTIIDILEAIVGDIPITGERDGLEAVQRKDGSWLLDGMLPVDEFRDIFRLNELPGEGKSHYETMSGFVMTYLGRIPSEGDAFDWAGMHFEVLDMDGFRVDKILVVPASESDTETGQA
jgi:putative hemolysin